MTTLFTSHEHLNNYLVLYVPQLIGVLFLILLGWAIASSFNKLTLTTIKFISKVWKKLAQEVAVTGAAEMKAPHAIGISDDVILYCGSNT